MSIKSKLNLGIMTAKEKAIELYEKYFYSIPISAVSDEEESKSAYDCTMICVNEVLEVLYDFNDVSTYKLNYWLDVRKELQSLK